MEVRIVTFPETRIARLRHEGPTEAEHATALRLVAWKVEQRLLDPSRHRSYGLHHLHAGMSSTHRRVDFCVSIDRPVGANAQGIDETIIPACRCALARDVGSRMNNRAAAWLFEHWLPSSGEAFSGDPVIFHYVNVGPSVKEADAITDVYLPLA